ncbi:MAG TPA: GAF domain-containing protein [Anaerolineales bacterium]|nr:GAF domain-containing protein [Anaerolineales bacterium]
MFKSLQSRLILLFAAFVLLVLIAVGAMYWGLETEQQDALTINLAGRQRMLSQQMARLAFASGAGQEANNTALQGAEQAFDQTLHALLYGGAAPELPDPDVMLPVTRDPQIVSALDQEDLTWTKYRAMLDNLQRTAQNDPSFSQTLQSIQRTSGTLAQQADAVVRLYETASNEKIDRLRAIQFGFLAGAFLLLGIGAWTTRQSVLKPLQRLSQAAVRVGGNDLDTVIPAEGPAEMRELAKSFDAMRINLNSSRQELVRLNESLEARVAQRTRELETLNEVSREISSRLDIQQVLDSVTEKARSLLGGEVASLCLVDDNQHWLKLQAISGPKNAVQGDAVLVEDELAGAVLGSRQALLCGTDACRSGCRMLNARYRTSHMAAPLRIGERVIGALCVGSPAQNRFAGETTDMLTKLANAAAIALENARLYAQAERVATLEERRRVAAEMHDGLGQTLSYLGLMTDQVVDFLSEGQDEAALERLRKTREAIGRATAEVRRAIHDLIAESPPEIDLCDGVQTSVNEFASENKIPVIWHIDRDALPKCSSRTAEQVLNITQEALKNVAHHAQAQHITVGVGQIDDQSFIAVEDDGIGFDTSRPEPSGHFGLQIMQARAAHIGGTLEIESTPGKGTRLLLRWPNGSGR